MARLIVALFLSFGVPVAACPCCPTCHPLACPCECPECAQSLDTIDPVIDPSLFSPLDQQLALNLSEPSEPSKPPQQLIEAFPTQGPTQRATPPPQPGQLLKCPFNCYGNSATPIALGSGDATAIEVESSDDCRQICMATKGCEAIVFGEGLCYGKADVHTSKCQFGQGFTTQFVTTMPRGTCTIMGDPHILTFDNPNGHIEDTTELRAGVFILVQSKELQLQGRFGFNSRFPAASSLTGIAISGSLIRGDKLTVVYTGPPGPSGFQVKWNNRTILEKGVGTSFQDDHISAQFDMLDPEAFNDAARHTIGGTSETGILPSLLFQIVPDIQIYLLLGNDTMNAVVSMRKLVDGQDGLCGNFNCDPEDDQMPAVKARMFDNPIAQSVSLFSECPPQPKVETKAQGPVPDIQTCESELFEAAKKQCASLEGAEKDDCIFDVCASGDPSAGAADSAIEGLTHSLQKSYRFLGHLSLSTAAYSMAQVFAIALLCGAAVAVVVVGLRSRRGKRARRQIADDFDAGVDARSGFLACDGGAGTELAVASDEEDALLHF